MSIASITSSLVASFNSYGTAVKTKIANAKSAGDNAQATANAASTAASSAQSTANTAQTTANAANTAAGTAQSTANTAKATADSNTTSITNLNAHVAKFDTNQIWTKAQAGQPLALAYAASLAIDLDTSNNFSLGLTGNITLDVPTNVRPGQSGLIKVTQDATGSRVMAFNTIFKFTSGTAPVLSTAANAVDYLAYYVDDASNIYISLVKDVK